MSAGLRQATRLSVPDLFGRGPSQLLKIRRVCVSCVLDAGSRALTPLYTSQMPSVCRRERHQAPSAPRALTVRIPEACRLTGIGRSKLYELIRAGDIRTVKVGTITLIPVASLTEFLGLQAPES